MTKIEQNVFEYIRRENLLKVRQTVLVALSGGADSVCLALILQSLGYDCHAAHCNFHLRGEESMRDELFVSSLCARLGIPLHKTDFDTKSYASEHGVSIEMAARDLRYDFFCRTASMIGTEDICVAHHKDDNVETFLLNAARGTGVTGLCGIRPSRRHGDCNIVRPLLCVSRLEILNYLENRRQDYIVDSTNLSDEISRNRIRLNVVPQLRDINPAATANICNTIANLVEVEKVFKAAIDTDIKRCETAPGILSVAELSRCVSPSSVLHLWLEGGGFNHSQEKDVLRAALSHQSGKLFPGIHDRLLLDRGTLVLESLQTFATPGDVSIELMRREDVKLTPDPHKAYIDVRKLHGNIHVRTIAPSDTFQPFGMKGRRLVSDFLTDRKLNMFQKERQLVLCDDEEIVWIVGQRASERFRVDEDTEMVLVARVKDCEK